MAVLKKYEFATLTLRAQIGTRYKPGDELPPEGDLARSLGVSMFTLRRAIEPLVRQGLLKRQQGKRTVVASTSEASLGQAPSVLLISLDLTPFFYDEVIELQRQLFIGGFNTVICNVGLRKGEDLTEQFRQVLQRHAFDAVVCGPAASWSSDVLPAFEEMHRPAVFFKNRMPIDASYVTVDLANASYEALRHLKQIGCRRIRCFINPDEQGTFCKTAGIRRYQEEFHPEKKLEDLLVPALGWTESGYAAALRQFSSGDVPDGVLAHNDFCAIGILMAAGKLGIRVPDDMALIGFDGMGSVEHTSPPLSTMMQPKQQIAQEVVRILKDQMADPISAARRQVVLHATLTARQSTLGFARMAQGMASSTR